MKKGLLLLVVVILFASVQLRANDNWKYRAAVNVGYSHAEDDCAFALGAEYGYIFKDRLLMGAGVGYYKTKESADPLPIEREFVPVYADIKCYMPLGGKVSFIAGTEIGYSFMQNRRKWHDSSNNFLVYPQIGFDIKLLRKLSLEISGGYRCDYLNRWSLNVGIAF